MGVGMGSITGEWTSHVGANARCDALTTRRYMNPFVNPGRRTLRRDQISVAATRRGCTTLSQAKRLDWTGNLDSLLLQCTSIFGLFSRGLS